MFKLLTTDTEQSCFMKSGEAGIVAGDPQLKTYSPITTNGLICYFPCDDTTTPFKDIVSGATLTPSGQISHNNPGLMRTCWNCSYSSSSYGYCNSSSIPFSIPTTFSLSVCIKPDRGAYRSNSVIFEFGSNDRNTGYGIWMNTNRQLTARINQNWNYYGSQVSQDWHNVIFTYDGQTIRLYLDGELYHERSYTGTPNDTSYIHAFSRGPGAGNYWEYYTGSLDEVRLYNRVLTADEIARFNTVYSRMKEK